MNLKQRLTISVLLMLCLTLVVTGNALAATASGGGFSGLINIPTADTLTTDQMTLGYQLFDGGDKLLFNYGVKKEIELGLTGSWYDNNINDDENLALNVKLKFMEEAVDRPALAMGLADEDLYVAASKNLDYYDLRTHIGIGNGDFEGLFAGLSKTINPVSISTAGDDQFEMPVTTLMLDYIDHNLNAGARFKINPQFTFNVALEDLSDLSAGVHFNKHF